MYRFEKLKVWHDAMDLVEEVYKTINKLPKEEKYALADQLKRSSTSIVLNISEGSGSMGDKDFNKFLRIALKSLHETVAGLKIAEHLFGVDPTKSLEKCDLVGKELTGLIKSLKL